MAAHDSPYAQRSHRRRDHTLDKIVPALVLGGKSLTYPASTGGIGYHRRENRGGTHGAGKWSAGSLAGGPGGHQQLAGDPEQLFGRGHGQYGLGFAGRRHAAWHDRLPDDGDDA